MQESEALILPDVDRYSPFRLYSNTHSAGDRFIPNRSLMDFDKAHTLLTARKTTTKPSPNPKFGDAYRKRINEQLTLDSEGKPFRMLVFRGCPKPNRKPIPPVDDTWQSEEQGRLTSQITKKYRNIPKKPDIILDAPNLSDDYYQNILDWGKNNILTVVLGRDIYFWNAKNKVVNTLPNKNIVDDDYPSSAAWSGNGKTLASGHFHSEIRLWDAESRKLVRRIEGHKRRVGTLAWNGHILTSGSLDKTIINHDVRVKNSSIIRVKAHRDEVCGLKWSGRGNLLASGGGDDRLYIWDISKMSSGIFLHKLNDHKASVKALAWCPHDTNILASGGGIKDGTIKLWNVQKGLCISSVDTQSQICALEWNMHHKELLSGHGFSVSTNENDLKNKICLWKYPSMNRVAEISGHSSRVLHLTQSPDGLTVISAGADQTLQFWEIFGPVSSVKSSYSGLGSVFSNYRSIIR